MMIVETGRAAVWQHAKEAGISDDIVKIAKHFDIKDISIILVESSPIYTSAR